MLDMRHAVPPDLDAATVSLINAASPAAYVRQCAGDLPMFVARAGLDVAMINQGIDLFIQEALAGNASLDLANHSTGRHGFDCFDDDDRSFGHYFERHGFCEDAFAEKIESQWGDANTGRESLTER